MGLLNEAPVHHHTATYHPSRALSAWMSNGIIGASQDTIERTTFAHKYSKPVSNNSSGEGGAKTGSSDDKCTICISEYEPEENVR